MKCQILCSRKNQKNNISLASAEFAQSIESVKIKMVFLFLHPNICCGYSLEKKQLGQYHNICFHGEIRKKQFLVGKKKCHCDPTRYTKVNTKTQSIQRPYIKAYQVLLTCVLLNKLI